MLSAVPYVSMYLSATLWSLVSDWIRRKRYLNTANMRKLNQTIGNEKYKISNKYQNKVDEHQEHRKLEPSKVKFYEYLIFTFTFTFYLGQPWNWWVIPCKVKSWEFFSGLYLWLYFYFSQPWSHRVSDPDWLHAVFSALLCCRLPHSGCYMYRGV